MQKRQSEILKQLEFVLRHTEEENIKIKDILECEDTSSDTKIIELTKVFNEMCLHDFKQAQRLVIEALWKVTQDAKKGKISELL